MDDRSSYNLTTSFYAKWILPLVLIAIGTTLLLIFFQGMFFVKDVDKRTKEETIYYKVNIDNETRYVNIDDKYIYTYQQVGTTGHIYVSTGVKYEKKLPWFSKVRMNLGLYATVTGSALDALGAFMLIINGINKLTKYDPKKKAQKIIDKNNEDEDE